jgi:hypothetical protein
MGLLGTATINIAPPAEDGGARITSYLVTSSPAAVAATFTPVQIKAAKITGLTPGSTYSFSVVAINSKGSSPSSIASAPALAPTIPNAPGITKVVATGTNSAQLTFTAPLDNGGSPITSFVATSNPGSLQTTVYQSDGGTFNITNLSHSTSYTFSLKAINAAGSSLPSSTSPSITTATPPPPPEPVAVAPTPALAAPAFTLSSSSENRTVNTAATGFTISSTGGAIASFAISATPAGMSFNLTTGALTGTPTSVAGATAYTITATNGTGSTTQTFTLTVTAVVISVAAIAGVTAPVTGATPVTTTTAGTGYTGTVTWSGSPATFASATTYTATITLTPTSGYTLTGVSANFFTVARAAPVTHSANTGVITAVFYMVGATGPGGGNIFYVASSPFACGPTRAASCTYLEAAPSGWNTGADPTLRWANTTYQSTTVNNDTSPETATANAIGWGYRNTLAIVLQGNTDTATSAAALADSYTVTVSGIAYDDWFLPSKDELNQMCKWARGKAWTSDSTRCSTGTINSPTYGADAAGFVEQAYWSSTEYSSGTGAYLQFFNTINAGIQTASGKSYTYYVRPVRAFGQITPATVISVAAIAGVTAPVTGATPVSTTTAGTGYIGTVTWSGSPATFASVTTYTATITLTPTSGYTLTGVSANFFSVTGATSVTHSADAGVITAVFPATAATVISVAAIAGVTAPVTDATPVSTTTAGTGYTGTVTWSGSLTDGKFVAATVYTATITLTPTSGYTLTGVTANFFTVAGATSVTNSANAGVITAVFYMVGATGPGGGKIFYVAADPFACGPTLAGTCTYLEAAPTSGANAWTDAAYAWSGNTSDEIGITARGTFLGTGYANTLAIVGQTGGGVTAARAGTIARAYRGPNSLSDWYLPSKDELNQMCKWARGITGDALTNVLTGCTEGNNTGLGAEGFVADRYTSSSEYSDNATLYLGFNNGSQGVNYNKWEPFYVRPVRSF